MLSLAQNVMQRIFNELELDYILVSKDNAFTAQYEILKTNREDVITKLETKFNGFESNGAYVIIENGALIHYFDNGIIDIRLTGDSMREVTDIFLKSILVENVSFENKGSDAKCSKYVIEGDYVGLIDSLLKQYYSTETTVSNEKVYRIESSIFKIVIVEEFDNEESVLLKVVY